MTETSIIGGFGRRQPQPDTSGIEKAIEDQNRAIEEQNRQIEEQNRRIAEQPISSRRTPVEAPNTLLSEARVLVIDVLCEGEIEGLVDGRKSIFLDNTALEDSTGKPNFEGAQIVIRPGTQAQEHVKGVDNIQSEIPVSIELTKRTGAIVRTILDTQNKPDRVVIRLMVPALLLTDLETGDILGTSVQLKLERQYNGGQYTTVSTPVISGKCNSQYEVTHAIPLDTTQPFPVNIRVSRITEDSPDTRLQNKTFWQSYTEVIDIKLRYPNTAYVVSSFSARQFSSIPTRAYFIKGTKINLPSNATVDPSNGRVTYTGLWNGTFGAAQWAADPAWALWDLLTSTRYGFGDYVKPEQLDKFTFYSVSQYCNQLVSDGKGGQEPRFLLNINLNTRQEAYNLINDLLSVFMAISYWQLGSLQIVQDSPADPVYHFSQANVVGGNFTNSGSSLKTRSTVVIVQWYDTDIRDIQEEYVEDADGIAKYGIIVKRTTAIGCTSQSQANRYGQWLLFTEKYETEVITFDVSLDAGIYVRPGQIISITNPVRSGTRRGGRVLSSTINSITVDATAPAVGIAPELSVILPNGQLETRTNVSLVGNTYTVTPNWSQLPSPFSAWILSNNNAQTELYRVVGIAENDQDTSTYSVNALKHIPGKWAFVEDKVTLAPRKISTLRDIPPPPTNITVTEQLYTDKGTARLLLLLSWTHAERAVKYQLRYRHNAGNYVNWGETNHNSVEFRDAESGIYEFQLQSISILNISSQPIYLYYDAAGLLAPPKDVKNFTATPLAGQIKLMWQQSVDLDVLNNGSILIRHNNLTSGVTFSNSVPIAQFSGRSTEGLVPALTGTYLARFVDSSGVQSINDAIITTDIPLIDAINVIATSTQHPSFNGTLTNCFRYGQVKYGTNYDLAGIALPNVFYIDDIGSNVLNFAGLADVSEVQTFGAVDNFAAINDISLVLTFAGWDDYGLIDWDGGTSLAAATYLFDAPLDLGDVYTCRATASIQKTDFTTNNLIDSLLFFDDQGAIDGATAFDTFLHLYFRTTLDNPSANPTWTPWREFIVADYTARAYEFKIEFGTTNAEHNLSITQLEVKVDVPDRIESEQNVTYSGNVSKTVTFSRSFVVPPAISITMEGATTGDYYQITGRTPSQFTVTFYNAALAVINRQFDWIARGY
jgi:predicted phage tail protein